MQERNDTAGSDPETLSFQRWWRVIAGWALIALGGLFILLGWVGVSGDPNVARQLSYLASGGVGGLACAVVGVGLLISEDLRADRRRLGRIEAAVLDLEDLVRAQSEHLMDGGANPRDATETRRSR